MSEDYTSKRLQLRRPPLILSISWVIGGGIIILTLFVSVLFNYKFFSNIYQFGTGLIEGDRGGDVLDLIAKITIFTLVIFLVVFFPAFLRYLIKGFQFVLRGISEIVTPWMPANIPEPYQDYEEVDRGFMERTLSIYKPLTPFLSGIFGGNSMFVTPVRREIIEENGEMLKMRARRFVVAVFGLIAIILFMNWLKTEAAYDLFSDLDLGFIVRSLDGSLNIMVFFPFIILIFIQIGLAIVEYFTTLFLIPRLQPSTVADEAREHYRGFGHPDQVFSRLPEIGQSLRWEGFLNRVDCSWDQKASVSVGDVGEFTGRIFIEQQPRPVESNPDKPAFLSLGIGWILLLFGLGLYLFLLLPSPFQLGNVDLVFGLIYIPAMGIAASVATRSGGRFIRYGRTLLESAEFRSIGLLVQIRGTLSRADIKVGKSIADSIESSNVVVRSDFTASFWGAELISEAARLDSKRNLLALERTPEAHHWIEYFRGEIENLRGEGVRPIGIDLEGQDVGELVNANLRVSALRSSAIEKAQLEAGVHGSEEPLLLESVDSSVSDEDEGLLTSAPPGYDEFKECPDCAEMVRARARICRFCGYQFNQE
jgi:hypothetical protein